MKYNLSNLYAIPPHFHLSEQHEATFLSSVDKITNIVSKAGWTYAKYIWKTQQGEALNVPAAFWGLWSSSNKKIRCKKNKMKKKKF